jgi:hypothetical protein
LQRTPTTYIVNIGKVGIKIIIGKKRNIPDVFANVLRMHPNEIGHLLWAEYLFDYINEYEIMDTLNYDKQKKINLI